MFDPAHDRFVAAVLTSLIARIPTTSARGHHDGRRPTVAPRPPLNYNCMWLRLWGPVSPDPSFCELVSAELFGGVCVELSITASLSFGVARMPSDCVTVKLRQREFHRAIFVHNSCSSTRGSTLLVTSVF